MKMDDGRTPVCVENILAAKWSVTSLSQRY